MEGKVRAGQGDRYPGRWGDSTHVQCGLSWCPDNGVEPWGLLASSAHKEATSVPTSLLCPRRAPLRETEGLDASGPCAFQFRAAAPMVSQECTRVLSDLKTLGSAFVLEQGENVLSKCNLLERKDSGSQPCPEDQMMQLTQSS